MTSWPPTPPVHGGEAVGKGAGEGESVRAREREGGGGVETRKRTTHPGKQTCSMEFVTSVSLICKNTI